MPTTEYHLQFTARFRRAFQKLTKAERLQVGQTLLQLRKDPWYPSFHTKKVKKRKDLFESRVSRRFRILWQYGAPGFIILADVGPHSILP